MIRKFAIALGVMLCSMSAWAGGNFQCTVKVTPTGFTNTDIGNTSTVACFNAAYGPENAQGPCENMIAYGKAHGKLLSSCHPLPFGVFAGECSGGGCEVCSDATCATPGGGENVCYSYTTDSPTNPICHGDFGGMVVVSNTQIGTGSNWGTQYGSLRNYDSVQGTTPDTITYIGPEDGQLAIEVSANAGLNSTAVTAVTLTNASTGFNAGTITHAQTSPDIWLITGHVTPLSSYTIGVTFSHTGGYGEYAVKMNSSKSSLPSPSYVQWIPALQFGGSSTGITYSTQQGTCTNFGNQVTCEFYITLTSKGMATGSATLSGLPYADTTSIVAGGGLGQVLYSGLSSITAPVLVEVGFGAVNFEEQGVGAMTNSNFTNTSTVVGTFSYLKQ